MLVRWSPMPYNLCMWQRRAEARATAAIIVTTLETAYLWKLRGIRGIRGDVMSNMVGSGLSSIEGSVCDVYVDALVII